MKIIAYCLECNKQIIDYPSRKRKFCNSNCSILFSKKNPNKGTFKAFQRIKNNCLLCGKELFCLLNSSQKYCSYKCYGESRVGKERDTRIGKAISKAKKGKVIISEKQKEQIRKALTGRKLSKEHIEKMRKFRKGKPFPNPPTLEQHKSLKWRTNISKGLLGRKLSEEHIKTISGKNNHFWKGGITPLNKKIRNSSLFKEWREKVFKKDNYTCWICQEKGGKLHPHHLKKFSEYPKSRFDINNGITLCEFCHRIYTNFGGRIRGSEIKEV